MNKKLAQGKKYYNSGQYKKALAVFDKLEAELATLLPADLINSVLADEEKQQGGAGEPHEQQHQDLFVEYSYYKGLTLTKLGRFEDALHFLEQVANAVQPGLLYVYQSRMIMGYLYIVTKRYKIAEYEFNKLLSAGIESVQIYALLGYASYAQNKITQSIGYFKKALKLDPEYPNALNCLGFIYADRNIDTAEATNLCKKAVNQKPDNAAYLDSLGWAYYKNNQFSHARSCLSKALEFAPENEEILAHIQSLAEKIP